jgi:hypothetical protein
VREVRAHLKRRFPAIDHREVGRILASHGLRHYPDALMLVEPAGAMPSRGPFGRRNGKPADAKLRQARPLPYFSEAYYRLANDDVRDLDVPMVLHWQVFGRVKGRSPHPFLNADQLAEQIPDVLPGEVVDAYLTDARRWLLSPSPYLETESFMLAGPWDGRTHPWLQIMRDYRFDPWMRGRLGVIDLADADDELQLAAAVLTARNLRLTRLTGFTVFEPGAVDDAAGAFRVVPGFFLGRGHTLLATTGRDVISGDTTAIRLQDRVLVVDVRDTVTCGTLVFITTPLDESALTTLATAHGDDALVAPLDADQGAALERLGVRTLPHARQARVEAEKLEIVGESR